MLYHVKLSVTSIEVLLGLQWKLWNMVKTVQRNPYNISENIIVEVGTKGTMISNHVSCGLND